MNSEDNLAMRTLENMEEQGITPNFQTVRAMISAAYAEGRFDVLSEQANKTLGEINNG